VEVDRLLQKEQNAVIPTLRVQFSEAKPMHISKLKIRNFRNFRHAEFNFEEGVNTLIGENGVGKTNAFHAIRLLLDESLPRNATSLRESDFNRSLKNWRGHWIIISIDFENLDATEGCQMLKHKSGHMDKSLKGTHTLYFRPKAAVRKKLYEVSTKNAAEAVDLACKLTIDDSEPVWTGRALVNISSDTDYAKLVGVPLQGVFTDPDKESQDFVGVRVYPIHREIACTFIKALRDVISELQSYRGNPLLTLLRGLESEIQISEADKITAAITTLNENISSLTEIKELSAGIQGALHESVGHTFSPEISIESTLPDSMEQLLKKLGILVGETDGSDHKGEMSEQSLGNANLIYLALKFLEYQRKLSSDRVAHFLLIEEPEAHLHAHVQKTLFNNLGGAQTQVIVSTHSTQISSIAKIKSVNVFAMQSGRSEVYQPANGLDAQTISRVERYVDAVRSTLLFAKGVVLVEGEAELIMIPALVRGIFGVGVDELGLSVIAMNSAFFEHIGVIFAPNRLRRRCAVVSDHDQSIVELPADPADDDDDEKHFRAAQKSGNQRKQALEKFTKDNPWIGVYLASYTFEVDFLKAGNAYETKKTLGSIYVKPENIKASSEELDSKDIAISGKEILRLAQKEGKGWFALLLAEQVFVRTGMPDYILQALAFASQDTIRPETLKQMGLHRIFAKDALDEVKDKFPESRPALLKMAAVDFVGVYRDRLPKDDLSRFCQHLDDFSMTF
jgi:putative ATP-dependent endonuclease of OLD family